MLARTQSVRTRTVARWVALNALHSDAALYGVSSVFALILGVTSSQPAQARWGFLAAGPYAAAAAAAWYLGRLRLRRESAVRLGLLVLVVAGAFAMPLGLEARWRQIDHGQGYAQPEVSVIERAATSVSKGKDPYRTYERDGRLYDAIPGLPSYQSFFPYFPLMSVFGLPSAATHESNGLTDARIIMSLMTLAASGLALGMLRAPRAKKVRVAQVMLALPTGALFLATGGDDMPILALSLLGVAALQRRLNLVAGVSLGLAAAMKLTAWPFAVGALLVAREPDGRRAWKKVALIIAAIVAVTVAPFAVRAPWAFMSNVFAFPLGLAGVSSPAASALPGHILTTVWPTFGHVLAPLALLVGGYYAARYLRRHWPIDLSQLLLMISVAFLVLICAASATRIGYVIYPLNFALWSWVCSDRTVRVLEPV